MFKDSECGGLNERGARRRQKAASVEQSAGRLAKFEAASDNELVIGCAVRSVLRAPRSTPLLKIPTQVNDSARTIRVMLTAAKEGTFSASSEQFRWAWGSREKLRRFQIWETWDKTLTT
jgi:hypothetical protein